MCKGRPEGAIWIKLLQRNTRCYTLFYGFRTTTAISHRVNSKNINQRRNIRTWKKIKWQNIQLGGLLTIEVWRGRAASIADPPPGSRHAPALAPHNHCGGNIDPLISSVGQNNNNAHSTLWTHLWMCDGSFWMAGQTLDNWRQVSAGSRPGSWELASSRPIAPQLPALRSSGTEKKP